MFTQYIPSQEFMTAAKLIHCDTTQWCSRSTTTTYAKSTENVWNMLPDNSTYLHRIIATIVFFSQSVRRRLMMENVNMLTSEELDVAIAEWSTVTQHTSNIKLNYCACGHDVAYPIYITNSHNSNVLMCGLECAISLFPHLKDVIKIMKIQLTTNTSFSMCGSCYGFKIPPNESWKTVCPDCYNSNKRQVSSAFKTAFFYKDCSICGLLAIPGNKITNTCESCRSTNQFDNNSYIDDAQINKLIIGTNGIMMKECTGCKKQNIPPNESWKSLCQSCYSNNSTSNSDKLPCQKCGLKKIPLDKSNFKLCYTCYKM